MTPFGLRKRIKGLMDPKETAITRHSICFVLPNGTEQTIEVEEGYNIVMASEGLSSPMSTGRRAGGICFDGGCASCVVEVVNQQGLTPIRGAEEKSLEAYAKGESHEGREREPATVTENTRLGCHARVVGPGAKVKLAELMDFSTISGDPDGE